MHEIQNARSTARQYLCVLRCPQMVSRALRSGRPLRRCISVCPTKYCSSYQGLKLLAAHLRYDPSGRPLDSVSVHLCVWKCLQMDSKGLQSGRPLQRCIHKCPSMYCSSPQGSKLVAARLRYDTNGRPLDIISVSRNAPEWAEGGFGAVDRSRGAFLSVLPCVIQVLKAYNQLLHTCNAVHVFNRSTSPVGFLKRRL